MQRPLALVVLLLACAGFVAASPEASAPVLSQSPAAAAAALGVASGPVAAQPAAPVEHASYAPGHDFVGRFQGLPMNPAEHLKASLVEDRQYIASIMRMPMDLGDPANCEHSDLENDERELRKIALRINHRRTAMRQTDQWIRQATEGLARIESEIASTHKTAKNLAAQLDALEGQRADITAHVRRNALLNELDNRDSTLMRLKDARMKREVGLQKRHNEFALRNHKHNEVLAKLQQMRTKQGLDLGKLDDPEKYRFAQRGMESAAAEAANAAQAEAESEQNQDTAAVEVEADAEAETEVDAAAEEQSLESIEAADKQEQAEQAAEEAAEAEDE